MDFMFQVPRNQWFLTIVENLRVKIFMINIKLQLNDGLNMNIFEKRLSNLFDQNMYSSLTYPKDFRALKEGSIEAFQIFLR
jgi:hypothetical protein